MGNYEFQYDPSTGGLKKVYGLTQHQSIIDRNQERNNNNMAALLSSSIHESKKDYDSIVRNIAKDLYPMRDILCLQKMSAHLVVPQLAASIMTNYSRRTRRRYNPNKIPRIMSLSLHSRRRICAASPWCLIIG